ncbi:hypothetical protein EIP91_007237 [Steccherinum ochraceum]|uniref:Rho-GAP domain-containing protein n=1 Tax=Steccherinum ochraceum TaxID=92696 RepID=A0A4R0RIS4_9APHY|nr:hypothetical protein EIP91_007237 [Steccherinum ochraceum]
MYRSQHRRNKDISVQPQPSSMPVVLPSHSQTSFTSLASSDASSSIDPAVALPASNSSQTDITSSDQPPPSFAPVTSSKNRFFPLSKSSSPRAPSSLPSQMGQTVSRPTPSSSSESTSSGNRFRRVWAGRKKKSEDVAALLGQPSPALSANSKGKERDFSGSSTPSPRTPVEVQQSQLPGRQTKGTKNFIPLQLSSTLNVFTGNRRQSQSPKSPKFSGPVALPPPSSDAANAFAEKKLPLTPTSPNSPLSSMTPTSQTSLASPLPSLSLQGRSSKEEVVSRPARTDQETKQDWRKSDSTMTSHITVRPGAFGNRSPRPVSLAESSHSGHTVVVNKRLSSLITDADFAMPEEGDLDQDAGPRGTGRPSPTPQAPRRQSRQTQLSSVPPYRPLPRPKTDTPTLTRAAAEGFITPPTAHSTDSNVRGRLAAWTTTPTTTPQPRRTDSERPMPSPPLPLPQPQPQRRAPPPGHPPVSQPPSFRQTAVSMTGNLAPVAAGIAIGIGKRAAEKVHRVWGGFSSNSSSHSYSAYSSTSSVDQLSGPSSYQGSNHKPNEDTSGGRSVSSQTPSQPSAKSGWRKHRTPNAPSGTWSVASSASSVSECEALAMPSGPNLGTKLRGARLNAAGSPIIGGLVFGRKLDICVQQTAIERGSEELPPDAYGIRPLEARALPALVVRCAQHLLQWGVQEEGLFRVSGRPAHVARLRSEFDTGADYNLVESDPGDLDPHAVASIFKAYLRELPESLLTAALVPQFEAIMAAENVEAEASTSKAVNRGIGSKGPTLPSGPRIGISLRKPPSLSTLAMPNFAGMRTTSAAGLEALTALVALLPPENRDLLLTVTELITATAARSKETKMPIGNLLVVFCPSLNMNPSLLRVFCDSREIWNGVSPQLPSVSVDPPPVVLASEATQEGTQSGPSTETRKARPRIGGASRDPLATLYVPADQSLASLYQRTSSNSGSYVSALEGLADVDTRPSTPSLGSPHMVPPLSSSTDSLATPSTMSETSSFSQPPSLSSQSSPADTNQKPDLVSNANPIIVENSDFALPPAPRRPAISSPIPFPSSSDGSAPHTPLSPRRSFALLSFPPLQSSKASPANSSSSSSSLGRSPRMKRPSLHLLFSKLSSPSLKTAAATQSATDGTPNSAPADRTAHLVPSVPAYLAPHSAVDAAPPSLTTPIPSSPMNLGFGESGIDHQSTSLDEQLKPEDTIRLVHARTDSIATSLYTTPQETPVADRFRGQLPSTPIASKAEVTAPGHLPRSPSQLSLTPSISLGFGEDDWAQSVFMAAGGGNDKTS